MPLAANSFGYIEIDVKPGIVLISLKTTAPSSRRTKKVHPRKPAAFHRRVNLHCRLTHLLGQLFRNSRRYTKPGAVGEVFCLIVVKLCARFNLAADGRAGIFVSENGNLNLLPVDELFDQHLLAVAQRVCHGNSSSSRLFALEMPTDETGPGRLDEKPDRKTHALPRPCSRSDRAPIRARELPASAPAKSLRSAQSASSSIYPCTHSTRRRRNRHTQFLRSAIAPAWTRPRRFLRAAPGRPRRCARAPRSRFQSSEAPARARAERCPCGCADSFPTFRSGASNSRCRQTKIHCPSLVIPTGKMLYFSGFRLFSTDSADRRETSCSGETPPNRTHTLSFFKINPHFRRLARLILPYHMPKASRTQGLFYTLP